MSAKRAGQTVRPQIERMFALASALREREPVNCVAYARRFEVKRKTILRDLEFMRDRLGYEMEYNPSRFTYLLISAPEPRL